MHATPEFTTTMQALFELMQIQTPEFPAKQVVSITVDDKMTMNFFEMPTGWLNIIADIGSLPEKSDENLLLTLLNFNCFTPLHVNYTFKVGIDRKLRKVELWVRQQMEQSASMPIVSLYQVTLDIADMLGNILDPANQQAWDARRHGRSTAARMQMNNAPFRHAR